ELKKLRDSHPTLCQQFLAHVCERFDQMHVTLSHLSVLTVRERLARTLLTLMERFGARNEAQGEETLVNVGLSRLELADLAGTVVETTVRTLTEFKSDGLIGSKGRKIVIKDADKLRQI